MAGFGFQVDTDQEFENEYALIPDGWYPARANSASIKTTRSGGEMLEVEFMLTDGYANRRVYWTANIVNSSAAAQEMARKQLTMLARSMGIAHPNDSDELIGGECEIKIRTKPETEQYRARNEVKDFRPLGAGAPVAPAKPAPARPAAAPARSAPPWAGAKPRA